VQTFVTVRAILKRYMTIASIKRNSEAAVSPSTISTHAKFGPWDPIGLPHHFANVLYMREQ